MPTSSFDELKRTGRLPTPAGFGEDALRLAGRDGVPASETPGALRDDPALTACILQLASSALSGNRTPVTTVDGASERLGTRTLRDVTLGFALVRSNRGGACPAFDFSRHWSESLARAVTMQCLSWRFRQGTPAEAFLLGLLSDVGSLALASAHPMQFSEILDAGFDLHTRVDRETELFGIHHVEVARCLAAEWGLPSSFADALQSLDPHRPVITAKETEDCPADTGDLLRVAADIAAAFVDGRSMPADTEELQRTLSKFPQWKHDDLPEIWAELLSEWHRWNRILKLETQIAPERGARRRSTDNKRSSDLALPSVEVPALTSLRILAVDDDSVSLALLARHLRKAGHQVVTAPDGSEALRLALELNPQIVIADWMMPKMSGLDLCRALRHYPAGREMYFILLTGQGEDDHIVEAFEEGVDDYIVKPFRPRILMARVRAGRRLIQLQLQVAADKTAMQQQFAQMGVLNRRLEKASLTDPLTELPNRRFAMEELKRQWEFSKRHGTPLSAVMIDIDEFKEFNDTYGHDVGDLVLRETAKVLQEVVRQADVVCRLGGEEFLAILPDSDNEGSVRCVDRLRSALENHRIVDPQFTGNVTASFGLAHLHEGITNIDQLLKASDEALYAAKEGGRNRVCIAGEPVVS